MAFSLPSLVNRKLYITKSGVRKMAEDAPNSALERVFLMYGTVGTDKDDYFRRIYGGL